MKFYELDEKKWIILRNIIQKLSLEGLIYGVRNIKRIIKKIKHLNKTKSKMKNKENDIKTISTRDKNRDRENYIHD